MDDAVVIEAAITPFRRGEPVLFVDDMVAQGLACLDAGAGIIHHHHDMRLGDAESIAEMIEVSRRIQATRPRALVYPDYLTGKDRSVWEENGHLKPLAEAGALTMFAFDPGITAFATRGQEGHLTRTYLGGLRYSAAHELVEFSKLIGVPVSLGIFEPGHLRWAVEYATTTGFTPGTVIKLYFAGTHMVEDPKVRTIGFGLPPTEAALEVCLSMIGDCELPWMVSVFGDPVLDSPIARAALERGGHLRVGIEDAAIDTGMGNADMVAAAARLAEQVGRRVAAPEEALAVLAGSRAAHR